MTTTLENQILNQLKKEAFDSYTIEILERTIIKITKIIGELVFFSTFAKSEIDGSINEYDAFICDTTTTGKLKTKSIRTHFQSPN
jgi:hypothetical protein